MKIFQLIYASSATVQFKFGELKILTDKAAEFNKTKNITGLLVYGNYHFMQILEGPQENINSLYLKIAKDIRHTDLRILDYSQILSRKFSQWAMTSVDFNFNPLFEEITRHFFDGGSFEPYELGSRKASDIMSEYAKAI